MGKGPLAILEGECEEPIENGHSVLSYILDTRSKLNSMTDWATINDTKVQEIRGRLIKFGGNEVLAGMIYPD
jgi:hypothetical protein